MAQALIGRPRWPSGKAKVSLAGEDGMAAADRDLLESQFSHRCGKRNGDGAGANAHDSVSLLEVVDSEPGDRCGTLGIEEQQQVSEAASALEVVSYGVIVR
ncbi:hypothetical protein [Streptomyces sp. NPDC040750]|uniref:hypothetical protein n=1 Tax=Streptomyces sp. NPDC040750 TaxID=3154491 RepID=UPI0033DA7607